jgi:hypothetical protein
MAAIVFILTNSHDLTAPEERFEDLVFGVARGEIGKEVVTEFFRRYTHPMES